MAHGECGRGAKPGMRGSSRSPGKVLPGIARDFPGITPNPAFGEWQERLPCMVTLVQVKACVLFSTLRSACSCTGARATNRDPLWHAHTTMHL
jgi:hypothetical protein